MHHHTDFLGQDLKVGDAVVFNCTGRGLTYGLIEKVTAARVKVAFVMSWSKNQTGTLTKSPDQLAKVTCDTPEVTKLRLELNTALIRRMKREME